MPIDTYNDAAHAYQFGTTVTLDSGTVVDINGSGDFIAVQFDSVQVQQGETITAATLYVESTDNDGGRVITHGDDSDNAAALAATTNNISGRTGTTASVEVELTAIGTKAIDVTTELQEIVNRAGWVNLNRVVFVLEGASPSNDNALIDLGSANLQLVVNHPLNPPSGVYTLTGNTTYSAIAASIEDDHTIDLAGYELDIDAVPTETGITVETPGTAGTVVFSVVAACNISTWDFVAGTGTLITTLPANVTVGDVTGGTATNARGVESGYGAVGTATGGSASGAHGVNNNLGPGAVATAAAGTASGAYGVNVNSGVVSNAAGGGVANSHAVFVNQHTIMTATAGGTAYSHAVKYNYAAVVSAAGGSTIGAYAVGDTSGDVLGFTDSTEQAVEIWRGDYKTINGPNANGEIVQAANIAPMTTIYSIGDPHASLVVPAGVTITTLTEGGGVYNPFEQSRIR